MPTKKQRRRAEKERRHEYETVWVDAEGNELDAPPEEVALAAQKKRDDGKPKAKAQPQQQRGGRTIRVPPQPSWQRAGRRSLILGAVVFVLFYLVNSKSSSGHRLVSAIEITVVYTALFIPFTYYVDRWTYNRWKARADQQASKRSAKKR